MNDGPTVLRHGNPITSQQKTGLFFSLLGDIKKKLNKCSDHTAIGYTKRWVQRIGIDTTLNVVLNTRRCSIPPICIQQAHGKS